MYAIAVASQVQLAKVNEAASVFRDSVVPAYQQLNGFKSAMLLIDPTTGQSLGISLWESEADRAAVLASGTLQQQLSKFAAVLTGQPVPSTYEVQALV